MPPGFRLYLFDREEEMWAPQVPTDAMKQQRKATYLKVVARLKENVSLSQAQAELDNIAAQLAQENPNTNQGIGITAISLPEHLKGQWRRPLLILFAAVGLVLLIACANVANLSLARGSQREREFSIRAAWRWGHSHGFATVIEIGCYHSRLRGRAIVSSVGGRLTCRFQPRRHTPYRSGPSRWPHALLRARRWFSHDVDLWSCTRVTTLQA